MNRARWYSWRQRILEWLSVLLLVSLIIVPAGMLAWLAFFTDTFVVQAITVVDARDHTAEAVRGMMTQFTNKNIFFIRTAGIEHRLLADIPQIRDVHITRKLPGTLKLIIQEKTPAVLLLSNGKYHFVDEQGIAYEEARLDTLPGIVLPVIKNNDQQAKVTLGAPALSADFITFVREAQELMPGITGAEIAEIRIPSLAAREVHFLLENNWTIRFDVTRPLRSQMDVLRRLLQHTIPEEERALLEYVDLRIPNRVYYKTRL